ncbi:Ig-like domain-containing protein [Telluria beijingensis]|uniref:Ig-like domain-containing protein n=1 Tax=Telluria beijingensis TaxID=3068633 RepID=UPI00279585AE|nr:Ig-like domain-containing protein [Massilia sp. REN29]
MSTFSTHDSTINSFYLAFYGRPADPAGLKFWSTQLAANNGDMGAIVDFFAASEEARVRFGTDSVADRITEIYSQLFNRAPDAEGMAFWTNAIEQGHASLADIAMSILGGAQGSDATLSQLRKQAADAFTAKVEADGTEYSGYASIEAARILVRAVTPDATREDLDTLVDAAVSFADTATKTPEVVEAIAVNTTLLALFDTARGVKEPVALAKALADTAMAAAGDPVTLESLLRGGGMDKVLKVMPAKATLQDVVDALGTGGLPAAVEVVYPSTPSLPPAPSYKLSFVSVTEGKDDDHGKADAKADNVTREKYVDVTFGYRGNDLASGQKYEYRINGGEWTGGEQHIQVDTNANTVVLKHIDLSQGIAPIGPKSIGIMGAGPVEDLLSNIELRAVRSDKSVIDAVTQQIVYDHYAAQPWVAVTVDDKADLHFDGRWFTRIPQLIVEEIEQGATVEYSLVTNQHNRTPVPHQTEWSSKLPDLSEDGEYTILVRQIDVAGNISDERQFTFTLDREKPLAPTIALQADTGIPGDGVTNNAKVQITQLELSADSAWEYRVDGGEWQFGDRNDGSGSAVLDLGKLEAGKVDVQVRQFDAAGNVGDASGTLSFTFNATPPAYTISFAGVEQGKNDRAPEDKVTNVEAADVKFGYTGAVAQGLHFEYSIDNGKNWLTTGLEHADGVVTISDVDLTAGIAAGNRQASFTTMDAGPLPNLFTTVQLRLVDANEFVYASASETVELDRFADMLEVGVTKSQTAHYFGQNGVNNTNVAAILAKGLEKDATVQYAKVDGKALNWLDELPELDDGTYTFAVRQRDAAGNEGMSDQITFTLDRSEPGTPTLRLAEDTGSDAKDGVTSDGTVVIENLDTAAGTGWQYSTNGGETWTFSEVNTLTGTAEFELANLHAKSGTFQVRQVDAAGNAGKAASLDFTLLTGKPTWTPGLVGLSNELPGVLVTQQNAVDITFAVDAEADGTVQWRLKSGDGGWTTVQAQDIVDGRFAIEDIQLASADQTVELRVTDRAGNEGDVVSHLIDGPFKLPSLQIAKHATGIIVTSPIAGKILIGGVEAFSTDASKGAIAGSVMVMEQPNRLVGTISVVGEDGSVATDETDVSYTLGGGGVDTVTGRQVWGFGGADTLTGTNMDDYLNGGDGNDTIYSNYGADTLVGGTGADRIHLGYDGAVKTMIFEGGDTATHVIANGQSTAVLDMVLQPKKGDVLQVGPVFTAAPTVSDTYLGNPGENQVAIVRGTSSGGSFLKDPYGPLHLVQWSDGMHVNSILLSGYSGQRLGLEIDPLTGRMTLVEAPPPPMVSTVTDLKFEYNPAATIFAMEGSPSYMSQAKGQGSESGLMDKSGLSLVDYRTLAEVATDRDYTDGASFGVTSAGKLQFDDVLTAGLYKMSWEDSVIATNTGYMGAGDVLIAGGRDGQVYKHHFQVKEVVTVDGDIAIDWNVTYSRAYVSDGKTDATINTSSRIDVIVDAGTTLRIGQSSFSSGADDLIIGFDAKDDVYFFTGSVGEQLDRNRDGEFKWAWNDEGGKVVVAKDTEAVHVVVDGPLISQSMNVVGDATFDTLNAALDLKQLGGKTLILATNADNSAGALFGLVDMNNNGIIDRPAGWSTELYVFAVFSDGVPDMADIELVGTALPVGIP